MYMYLASSGASTSRSNMSAFPATARNTKCPNQSLVKLFYSLMLYYYIMPYARLFNLYPLERSYHLHHVCSIKHQTRQNP